MLWEGLVLKSAAVIGFYFSTTCLRHVLDEVAPGLSLTLDAALIGLIQANFVASQRRDAGGASRARSRSISGGGGGNVLEQLCEYSFVHETIQQTICGVVLREQRAKLHGIIARWYLSQMSTPVEQALARSFRGKGAAVLGKGGPASTPNTPASAP